MGIIFLPLMFLALWAIVILPQQRRVRAHQAVVAVLQEGDEVMTTSGILGTITAMDDELIHLEVAPGVTLRIVRQAIARRMNEPEPEPTTSDAHSDVATDTPLFDDAEHAGATADGEPSTTDS